VCYLFIYLFIYSLFNDTVCSRDGKNDNECNKNNERFE